MRLLMRHLVVLLLAGATVAGQPKDVLVFAAASLQTALDELAGLVAKATGVRITMSYAASSALARQVENGAPAEIFISADQDWMDYLAGRALLRPDSRSNLVGNRLVLIASKDPASTLKIGKGFGLAAALGSSRLALANPDVVPAGRYARAALTSLGVWDSVASRVAGAENVRAAMALVSRGESPLGIVYRTDASVDPGVVVVDTFPESTHPPIVYPIALLQPASPDAARVLAFLKSPAALAVFLRHGFTEPPR
jgi:molybdate transport system substrate-binding protein